MSALTEALKNRLDDLQENLVRLREEEPLPATLDLIATQRLLFGEIYKMWMEAEAEELPE